jgi:hypothetical protein
MTVILVIAIINVQPFNAFLEKSVGGQPTRVEPTARGLGVGLTAFHHKI